MDVVVNLWGVVAAVVAAMVVGYVWYMPAVFGKRWMKLTKISEAQAKSGSAGPMAMTVVAAAITAYVLAHVTYLSNQFFGNSYLQDALATAFWVWLGFTAARMVTHDAFEGRPNELTLLNAGNDLLTLLAMSLAIGLIGV